MARCRVYGDDYADDDRHARGDSDDLRGRRTFYYRVSAVRRNRRRVHALNDFRLYCRGRSDSRIEVNDQRFAAIQDEFPSVPALHGDCSDDETLNAAGIARAGGIVICTDDDKNALVTTVLARQLNPGIRIVARATTDKAAARLRQAGADGVAAGSALAWRPLSSLKLHEYGSGLLLLAMRTTDGEYRFNPPADTSVTPGCHLITMGDPSSVDSLRAESESGRA